MRHTASGCATRIVLASLLLGVSFARPAAAVESALVIDTLEINDPLLGGVIQNGSTAGLDVEGLGDLNGDSFPDVAFGAWLDDSTIVPHPTCVVKPGAVEDLEDPLICPIRHRTLLRSASDRPRGEGPG